MRHKNKGNTMKKTFATLILLALAAFASQAQGIDESMRYWDEGRLTWDDFEKRNFEGMEKSYLSPIYHSEYKARKYGNLTYRSHKIRTGFDKSDTWVRTEYISDRLLRYNQLILDIAEAYSREMQNELNSNSGYSPSYVFEHYVNKGKNMIDKMAEESKWGDDINVIERYEREFAVKLQDTPADTIPQFKLKNWGGGYQIGYSTGIFTGPGKELLKPHHNITLGFAASYKRSHFILDMEIGSGKTRTELPLTGYLNGSETEMTLPADTGVGHVGIDLDYGYAVYDGSFLKACPFVGVGASIFNKEIDQGEDTFTASFGGLNLLAGLNLNWKLKRVLTNVTYNETAIRTKIYAARTNLVKNEAPVWSINLGIAFDFYGRGPETSRK